MYTHYEMIKNRKEIINKKLQKIKKLKPSFPEGNLHMTQNGKWDKWFFKDATGTVYMPKEKRKEAEALAIKRYYTSMERDLLSELKACEAYLRIAEKQPADRTEKLLDRRGFTQLLGAGIRPLSVELQTWQDEPYEALERFPENKKYRGTAGRMLRSKSEAIIDKFLYEAGIPFRYEAALFLGNVKIYPDFTLRHPRTGKTYYWEHFGLMDDCEYVESACAKIKLYCENGIVPADNLILTYESAGHPLSIEEIENLISFYFK